MIARVKVDKRFADTAPRLESARRDSRRRDPAGDVRARASGDLHEGTWGDAVRWLAKRVPATALVLVRGRGVPEELVPIAVLCKGVAGAHPGASPWPGAVR